MSNQTKVLLLWLLLGAAWAVAHTASDGKSLPAAPRAYKVVEIASAGGLRRVIPTGINDQTEVVGNVHLPAIDSEGPTQGFFWKQGKLALLPTLDSKFSYASAINADGDIVGETDMEVQTGSEPGDIALFSIPIVWRRKTRQPFSYEIKKLTLEDNCLKPGAALTINDFGTIAGNGQGAFAWSKHKRQRFSSEKYDCAVAINNRGEILLNAIYPVYASEYAISRQNARLWRQGDLIPLKSPGGKGVACLAINNQSHIVGWFQSESGGRRARLWDIAPHDLGTLGGKESEARSINDANMIVGMAEDAKGEARACLWVDRHLIDLNTLLPRGTDWILSQATGINNRGEIIGYGRRSGKQCAFLLIPTK